MGNARVAPLRMDAARLQGEDLLGQREGVENEASDANNTRLCTFFTPGFLLVLLVLGCVQQ